MPLRTESNPNSSGFIRSSGIQNESATSSIAFRWLSSATVHKKNWSSVCTKNPEYKYVLGNENKYLASVTVSPVSSFTSRATPSSPVSYMSMNPPDKSRVPFAGSFPRLQTNSSFRWFRIKATVAALELKYRFTPSAWLYFLYLTKKRRFSCCISCISVVCQRIVCEYTPVIPLVDMPSQ